MSAANENLILRTDSYKASHFLQYPPGTTRLLGYFESRGGLYGETVFFGLQYLLDEYLSRRVTERRRRRGERVLRGARSAVSRGRLAAHRPRSGRPPAGPHPRGAGGLGRSGAQCVDDRRVDRRERALDRELARDQLVRLWYPLTVATLSWHIKRAHLRVPGAHLRRSAGRAAVQAARLRRARREQRGVGRDRRHGAPGELQGSDTIEGIRFARRYYGAPMAGVSIPAAEHSTVTAWGRERERDAYRNFVEQFLGPGKFPIAACVSDSYDLWNAIENIWCEDLRELIETSGSTLVIRPDSGDPPEVNVRALKILERKVGCRVNTKGYKVLPHAFRLIQGDGNDDEESIDRVLHAITSHGFSASNIAFGMGGGLLQRVHRDTQKIAFKVCEATVEGHRVPVAKNPVTDTGKASKSGNLDLDRQRGTLSDGAGAARRQRARHGVRERRDPATLDVRRDPRARRGSAAVSGVEALRALDPRASVFVAATGAGAGSSRRCGASRDRRRSWPGRRSPTRRTRSSASWVSSRRTSAARRPRSSSHRGLPACARGSERGGARLTGARARVGPGTDRERRQHGAPPRRPPRFRRDAEPAWRHRLVGALAKGRRPGPALDRRPFRRRARGARVARRGGCRGRARAAGRRGDLSPRRRRGAAPLPPPGASGVWPRRPARAAGRREARAPPPARRFDPFHPGHRMMADAVERRFGRRVLYGVRPTRLTRRGRAGRPARSDRVDSPRSLDCRVPWPSPSATPCSSTRPGNFRAPASCWASTH